ncbi:MAG TPA: acetyl-CoA carboxylase biotin carboxyl carrier protein [Thermoanaerobaculia bacterium]|jgi:acetyl-CoA carboxylase biotin carboxyl carrier protein|nr:acetyl-CoA carboxylase biotin carboxyl carrier protein [Thermoanaerobaculia bacterium]
MLSLKEIRELVDLVTERGLAGLEIERSGFRLRIEGPRPAVAETPAHASGAPGPAHSAVSAPGAVPAVEEDDNVHVITSPIVGTFYRSASPEAEAFADVGAKVGKGKILCIIESMKLMNEIESDVEGEVVAVYPRNGQPVEYGERLFAIRLAA